MDTREQKLNQIPLQVWLKDVQEEWDELLAEHNDIDVIVNILEDENYNWFILKTENKIAFYKKLISLVEQTQLTLNKKKTLIKLSNILKN